MPTVEPDLLIREWRVANRMTMAHENALARACLQKALFATGTDLAAERAKVQRMRDIANDLLQMSLAQVDEGAATRRRT